MTKDLQPKSEINLIKEFSVLSRNFEPRLKSDWACAEFTWSLSKLNCFCFNLAKSCTCLNLAMVSADNPRPLVFSPVLPPSPLSGRPIFSPSANNISWLYAITTLSFCVHFSFFCVQFSPKIFIGFFFPFLASLPYHPNSITLKLSVLFSPLSLFSEYTIYSFLQKCLITISFLRDDGISSDVPHTTSENAKYPVMSS